MELEEVGRRVIGRHWRLMATLAAACAAVAFVVFGTSPTYTVTARLVLNTPDPTDRAAAIAIADTGNALATSPAEVTKALLDAHVKGRDGRSFAKRVSVRGLGTSGVLQLSVTDPNPRVAAAVANALAARVIDTRRILTSGETRSTLGRLERQLADLNRRIVRVEAGPDSQLRRVRSAALVQQRNAVESAWTTLVSADAQRPRPQVVSRAALPDHPDHSSRVPDTILGALLGLVLGGAIAGLLETLRPTVVGGGALAAEFGAPLLGSISVDDIAADRAPKELATIATRLRLAADAAAVKDILLAGMPADELGRLGERLQDLQRLGASAPAPRGRTRVGPRINVFEQGAATGSVTNAGFVFVLPSSVEKRRLVDAANLLQVARYPLLGVIALRPARAVPSWRLRVRGRGDADTQFASAS